MSDEDKKSGDVAGLMKLLFIYSLSVGIEYGRELLARDEANKQEAIGYLNDTLKKLLKRELE